MRNLITCEEYEMIDYYRETYAPFGYGLDEDDFVPSKDMLNLWEKGKTEGGLNDLFAGSLVLEKEIDMSTPSFEVMEEIEKRLLGPVYTYNFKLDELSTAEKFVYNFAKLGEQLVRDNIISRNELWDYNKFFSPKALYSNKFNGRAFKITTPAGKVIQIARGAKVLKIIGKIAKEFNVEGFEEFRLVHSQIMNTAKIKGTLCLSIHPLDYMTMSDNASGWTSCMSWQEDGCYRQGTVEMMNSPCVVVGYIKGSKPMHIDDSEWSNKKYRSLYVVNKDIITNVKGYPYKADDIDTAAITWLKELAEKAWGVKYCDNKVEYEEGYEVTVSDNNYRFIFNTEHMYNDFEYVDHIAYIREDLSGGTYEYNYSGSQQCMWCGEAVDFYEEDHDFLVCRSCDRVFYCEDCDCVIKSEDEIYILDGQKMCYNCYNDHAVSDVFTGETHADYNMQRMILVSNRTTDEASQFNLWGFDSIFFNREYFLDSVKWEDYFTTRPVEIEGDWQIDFRDLTEKGWELFGLSKEREYERVCSWANSSARLHL